MAERLLTIKEARQRLCLSQTELGKKVGQTQTTISNVENGLVAVREKDKAKWEAALNQPGRVYFPR